jgi:uncharacterized protein (DUF4415 family)
MAKKDASPKRGRGRPKTSTPKDRLVGVRLDAELSEVVNAYQKRHNLDDAPSAIRHMIRRIRDQDSKS